MYIDTKERGLVYEPNNPDNKSLFNVLVKYQSTLDGSRLYDDLIDIYQSQELEAEEEAPVIYQGDIENPMVVDSLWNKEPKILGECSGCGENIYEGQDIYEFNHHVIHSDSECCRDFIANISICRVAGQ